MVALTWVGIVPWTAWLRAWRWAVLLIFVFAAAMTPTPDAVTMIAMQFRCAPCTLAPLASAPCAPNRSRRAKREQSRRDYQSDIGVGAGQGVGIEALSLLAARAGTRSLISTWGPGRAPMRPP